MSKKLSSCVILLVVSLRKNQIIDFLWILPNFLYWIYQFLWSKFTSLSILIYFLPNRLKGNGACVVVEVVSENGNVVGKVPYLLNWL